MMKGVLSLMISREHRLPTRGHGASFDGRVILPHFGIESGASVLRRIEYRVPVIGIVLPLPDSEFSANEDGSRNVAVYVLPEGMPVPPSATDFGIYIIPSLGFNGWIDNVSVVLREAESAGWANVAYVGKDNVDSAICTFTTGPWGDSYEALQMVKSRTGNPLP